MPVQETSSTQRALLLEIAELKRQLAQDTHRQQRALQVALALSLALHGAILLIPQKEQPPSRPPATRLEASLASPTQQPQTATVPPPAAAPRKTAPAKPQPARRPVLAVNKPNGSATSQAASK